jgi:hypothetical protein
MKAFQPVKVLPKLQHHHTFYKAARGNLLSVGSVDNKFATCAAAASKPSKSSGASSDRSPTSNPDLHHINTSD